MGAYAPMKKAGRRTATPQKRNRALSTAQTCFQSNSSDSRRHPIPVPTLPPAATKTALSVPWCALVEASSVSLASSQARKLVHSVASPLPAKFTNLPETVLAHFTRAISSLGACIQLSARIAISEREHPASNRSLVLTENSACPGHRSRRWSRPPG